MLKQLFYILIEKFLQFHCLSLAVSSSQNTPCFLIVYNRTQLLWYHKSRIINIKHRLIAVLQSRTGMYDSPLCTINIHYTPYKVDALYCHFIYIKHFLVLHVLIFHVLRIAHVEHQHYSLLMSNTDSVYDMKTKFYCLLQKQQSCKQLGCTIEIGGSWEYCSA